MKLGTDNHIWDNVLNPNMNAHIIQSKNGLYRGMQLNYEFDGHALIAIADKENNIGSNYKQARALLIKMYKEKFKEVHNG